VSKNPDYSQVEERLQSLWEKKSGQLQQGKSEKTPSEMYHERAGIYAEFGKIICISCGVVVRSETGFTFRLKSYYGDDEKKILQDFSEMLNRSTGIKSLCAHNGKEFDFPYISRRLLIQGLPIPGILNLQGKKPWEVSHLDTMELWKFGDYKAYTSLDLLAAVFDIPTPKDDISGADVGRVYWQEKNIERIKSYCEKDVITTCQVLLRMNGQNPFTQEQIIIT
jgi:DNA polymerase elongation subunit (family B)